MPVKFGFDNPFLMAWLLLHQTHNLVLKCENGVFGEFGLSAEQHSVLLAIKYIDAPVTPTDVARWLDRNTNSISVMVDRMVNAGLVDRIRDLRDRRSLRLVITAKGEKILDRATVAGWELIQEILSGLPEEDLPVFVRLLDAVREKSFEYLNPGETAEEIRRDEANNMSRFMKRVAKYTPVTKKNNL